MTRERIKEASLLLLKIVEHDRKHPGCGVGLQEWEATRIWEAQRVLERVAAYPDTGDGK